MHEWRGAPKESLFREVLSATRRVARLFTYNGFCLLYRSLLIPHHTGSNFFVTCCRASAQEWKNRTVAKHACSKMGRAAARRNAPKQPRVIMAGPNDGAKKLGPQYRGFIRFFPHTGGLSDLIDSPGVHRIFFKYLGFIGFFT